MFPIIIAILAPIVNCIQLFPQLLKIYKTKKVRDLSLYSIFLLLLTSILWTIHGLFIMDYSIIIGSLITTIININILFFFLYIKIKANVKLDDVK